jgi:diacylglycerol kinase family enzyme
VNQALGLVVNAAARAVKRRYLRRDLFWKRCTPAGLVHITANLQELDNAIAALRSAHVRVIAVLGGDGTLHHTIEAVIRRYSDDVPIILALAGGTMNGVSRALGSGSKPATVLRHVLHDLERDSPHLRTRHVLRVTDARDGRTLHGFSFATGLVYRALQQYYRSPDPGLVAAVRASLLPLTASLDDISLQATVGGTSWLAENPHTLVASIFHNPLLWFRPFGSPVETGKAFYLGATAMRRREIAPRLWSIFRGTCRHPRLRVGTAEEVAVRATGDVGYLIDGELYPTAAGFDVRLSVGPEIRFVAPGR